MSFRRDDDKELEEEFAYIHSSVVHAADWIAFLALFGTAVILAYKLMNFVPPPPHKQVLYFFGYSENGMISLWVNLFAACAYYGRICSHLSGDPNNLSNLVYYKYLDYLITCPLLTFDLLSTLNLPYKITYSIFVQISILSGMLAIWSESPGRYMWFTFGLLIFAFTWFNIVSKVQVRFIEYFKKKKERPTNKRMSIASKAGLRDKNIRNPLQTALSTYFCIWMVYPILWILLDTKLIDQITEHVINVVLDVLAKSAYGFALLRFQLLVNKSSIVDFHFEELQVTKADLMEEHLHQKKKMRRLQQQQRDAEEDERGSEHSLSGSLDDGPSYVEKPSKDSAWRGDNNADPAPNMPMEQWQMFLRQMQTAMSPAQGPINPQMAMVPSLQANLSPAELGRNGEVFMDIRDPRLQGEMMSPHSVEAMASIPPQFQPVVASRPAMVDENAPGAPGMGWLPEPQQQQPTAAAPVPASSWRSNQPALDEISPAT